MNELEREQRLKQFKENSNNCVLCGREVLFNGCSINIVSVTESGKIIAPHDKEEISLSAMIPLCAYHMVLAQGGFLALTTDNKMIFARKLPQFEQLTDASLLIKSKLKRNNPILEVEAQLAKSIINAREFQASMDKEKEEVEKIKKECGCKDHKKCWKKECEKCFKNFQDKLYKRMLEKKK